MITLPESLSNFGKFSKITSSFKISLTCFCDMFTSLAISFSG